MYVSIFDLFKIGIGPSSSHTMGPMLAASMFLSHIKKYSKKIKSITVDLHGSLAYTGVGHKTYEAILFGLNDCKADSITNKKMHDLIEENITTSKILINNHLVLFNYKKDIFPKYNNDNYKNQINPLVFNCLLNDGNTISKIYYSIGGGFVVDDDNAKKNILQREFKYNFSTMSELINLCDDNVNIYDIILDNEHCIDTKANVRSNILNIWSVMDSIINNGINASGKIDSILNVDKRANLLKNNIKKKDRYDPLDIMDWVNVFAIATSEENASGNKIVTAPTNGAAGIIPAVIKYYQKFVPDYKEDGIVKFIATASSIGMLFKINASISGAEMGCQGEVGVACSMAAAGLTAALNGTFNQIENAAEIAMEHNLGLTCDPVKGLVQIPCIERNSMGAIKAINSSRLALSTNKPHKVSLDTIIKTMHDTGKSMNTIFKETSLGGLAVNVVEC